MIPMTLGEAASALGGTIDPAAHGTVVRRVSTDSREVEAGDLFFGIRGPTHDGHAFIAKAGANGAVAAVCDRAGFEEFGRSSGVGCVIVEDTTAALGALASHYRRTVMPVGTVVIAVTGSNGKTTTKCMIDHVLSASFKGRASPRSFNNKYGLPLTILSTERDDQYLVTEIGTSARGEIAALAGIASPEVGVITSIGEAHLEGLGDIHGVADEKSSLLEHVRLGGLAVVNIDRPEIRPFLGRVRRARLLTIGVDESARLSVADRRSSIRGSSFLLDGRFRVEMPLPGAHHATNATAAFAVGRWFGMPCEQIIERLGTFVPPEGRTRVVDAGGITLVDDAYNANPGSVGAAIEALAAAAGAGRRVLVLGDMLELGSQTAGLHERIVATADQAGIDVLVGVGEAMSEAVRTAGSGCRVVEALSCADAEASCGVVDSIVRPRDVVWIKGSRAMGLDRLVKHLEARWGPPRSAVA